MKTVLVMSPGQSLFFVAAWLVKLIRICQGEAYGQKSRLKQVDERKKSKKKYRSSKAKHKQL